MRRRKSSRFGQRSKESLVELVFGHEVAVETNKRDRYGREIGKVLVAGRDVNLVQIERGMAWWYRAYKKEQSDNDQKLYESTETSAETDKKGLWADRAPQAPWDFRKAGH